MKFAEDTMAMDVNPEHKHFARIMGMKQAISSSVLTATARVNSGALRPGGDDGLDAMLARVKGRPEVPPEQPVRLNSLPNHVGDIADSAEDWSGLFD